ncbi:MAG: isochorismatase family protein [Peptoniphilaceae bacterium]|nr:isochorismatase family protein [Peptoniphilaceae bacterium]MDY6018823.1 isochorismatase family protein [Anaerococcus sp.]
MDINKYIIDKKDKPMLLLIDFQDKLGPQIAEFDKIVEKAIIVKEAFDVFDLDTIATEQYPKGLGRTDDRLLKHLDGEKIVAKNTFNSYTKEIRDFVKNNDIKKVIMTGAETHVCIYQTTRAMLEDGLDLYLLEDVVSSYNLELKKNALENLKDMGAHVISAEMLLFDLIDGKDSDNFKTISKLVKELRAI